MSQKVHVPGLVIRSARCAWTGKLPDPPAKGSDAGRPAGVVVGAHLAPVARRGEQREGRLERGGVVARGLEADHFGSGANP